MILDKVAYVIVGVVVFFIGMAIGKGNFTDEAFILGALLLVIFLKLESISNY